MYIRVKAVKMKVRIGVFVLVCVALLFVAASQLAVGNADWQNDCSACHSNPSTIVINTVTTIDTEPSATFSLNVQVDATGGPTSLVVKFPTGVSDNADFTYVGLDASGFVRDDDAADVDTDALQIEVDYSIVAPVVAGTYTLEFYAAGNGGTGTSVSITVNSIPAGPGPLITDINGTPGIPLEDEDVAIIANVTSAVAITGVTLQYSTNNVTWNDATMTLVGQLYHGTIPAQPDDTYVTYRIVAVDEDGIWSVSGVLSYRVGDIPLPPPPPPLQFHYGWYLGMPALVIAYIGTALEYYDEERFTREHGIMLSIAYFLTLINVVSLITTSPSSWSALNPVNLFQFDLLRLTPFLHSWHIWLGIISMIFGTLALISHLAGWKTCNLGLPAVILWTILGLTGMYFNVVGFVM
jgi:hypothetical protein